MNRAMDIDARVECRTPTPGKKPTRIEAWKYATVRRAILALVPRRGDGIPFARLPDLVRRKLSRQDLKRLGSVPWYTTTVKLDLEVRGELMRVPNLKPQHLRRS
ncbi:MAG: hypothetical protein JNK85_19395 [Verrucomicrobiales bacterium]|nr:hypothetical protein [Verrucomicrobiales bacterium]